MADERRETVLTVREILRQNAQTLPTKRALLYRTKDGTLGYYTHRKLYLCVQRLSTALLHRGLADKNIAVLGKNSVAWALAYLSVCCGVGTVVPVEREMQTESVFNVVKFASVKAIFADEKNLTRLMEQRKKLPKKLLLFSLEQEAPDGVTSIFELIDEGERLLDTGVDLFFTRTLDPDAMAFLLFTSGTTGSAKAVMLSHRNVCADIVNVCRRISFTQTDSTLCALPLHHTYQTIAFLTMLYAGGAVSFSESLRAISRDLTFYNPTVLTTVPLLLEKMHKKIFEQLSAQTGIKRAFTSGRMSFLMNRFELADLRKYVYSAIHDAFGGKLRMIVVGAAALNPDVARDFQGFGIPVVLGYGLTECSPIVMCNDYSDPQPDSVGKPLDDVYVFLDDQDESGRGELCVKGPMVMLGYYKNKKATAAVLQNGWLRTGDLAYCDDKGNYHITGRCKNVIVTKGGKNIYPEELEYYLNRDPLVLESLIFAQDTEETDALVATVVPDEDAIKEKLHKDRLSGEDIQQEMSDVVRRINRILPKYKNIRRVLIRDSGLEKTATQKVRRPKKKEPDGKQE